MAVYTCTSERYCYLARQSDTSTEIIDLSNLHILHQPTQSPRSDTGPSSPGGKHHHLEQVNNHELHQDQQSSERVCMKRFSSALCLADQQHQSTKSNKSNANCQTQKHSPQQQVPTEGGNMRTSGTLKQVRLAPDDPMVLARQRRPSASNQGSLNVDQQGEYLLGTGSG